MKRAIVSLLTICSLGTALLPALVSAQCDDARDPLGVGCGAQSGLGTRDIRLTIALIIQYSLGLLGMIAIVLILYAGFNWMTAAGEEEKIETAKKTLRAAVIGLVIILSAYALTRFILINLYNATTPNRGATLNDVIH